MKHKYTIIFGVLSGIIAFSCVHGEDVSVSTFYPIPSGVYRKLQSETLSIGERESTGLPSGEGVIRLQPRGEPSDGEEGDLYFDAGSVKFKYYDGSHWKVLGSGTASNCGWFRDECPVNWTSPGEGNEYHKQITNRDLPITGPQYRYIWMEHNNNNSVACACEPRNIDPDNPPTGLIYSPIGHSKNAKVYHCCQECYGYTTDCSGYKCPKWEQVYDSRGRSIRVRHGLYYYLYRCLYTAESRDVSVAGTYDMYYCCPPE